MRVILGLPFIFFFPGYTFTGSLFSDADRIKGLERVTLSFGLSIAVVALIGFALNYAPWGISLDSAVGCIITFIFVTSAIALIKGRQISKANKYTRELTINLTGWGGSTLNKFLSFILVAVMLGAIGTLGYTLIDRKVGERFSEFYLLGIDGKAEDYPNEYLMNNGHVTQVIYDNGVVDAISGFGTVILGIVNREQENTIYSVEMTINGQRTDISFDGTITATLGPIELQQGGSWVNEIGIIPHRLGENEKVEILLFKGNQTTPEDTLDLWINVK
jgi:uncharacterized membrane protein